MTYKEISVKYNIPVSKLYRIVHTLRLEGKFKKALLDFNKDQVNKIISYKPIIFPENKKVLNHVRKIAIVEFYIKFGGIRKVSRMLNIGRDSVSAAIKEYEQTGCIVVASKLNTMESFEENGNYNE